jgi:cellulose synthase (UDP-forming)
MLLARCPQLPEAPAMSVQSLGNVERRQAGRLYGRTATEVTGPLQSRGPVVMYRPVLSRREQLAVQSMGWFHVAIAVTLAVYLLVPGHLPHLAYGPVGDAFSVLGLIVMVALQLIVGLRTLANTMLAARARDPIPMTPQPGLRVAVLTTIVPTKEPVELVMTTLRAMLKIRHDGPLDVWLLDEGDDPYVRLRCEEMGVHYFTRKGVPEWNTESGPYRAKTKHGNHNSWRSGHEHDYDVVAQMDPDHVPWPNFLERTLGYFSDPDTAFVVAPQVYGNLKESFVARGSAELAYLFHGIIQRGANGNGAPLLIGTNHLYRPSAFDQIGGYQDSIIEDHLTSMVLYTAVNELTGRPWKGVYTPDILAVGEGPATYSDFFSQQKRWAYGIWQIARQHSPKVIAAMPRKRQRASFTALQLHYPTVAIAWVGGVFLSALYLIGGITPTSLSSATWGVFFGLNIVVGLAFNQYLRRLNLVEHERQGFGLAGMALELITAPVYVAAAAAQLVGRPLVYVVTAKGSAATGDTWRSFRPHLVWATIAIASISLGLTLDHDYPALYFWASVTAIVSLSPLAHVGASRLLAHRPGTNSHAVAAAPVPAQRRVGDVLVAHGLLSVADLAELLDFQVMSDAPWQRIGDLAVTHGYVTGEQVTAALSDGGFAPEQNPGLATSGR